MTTINRQGQVEALSEHMDRGFAEIKEMLARYEERLRGLETREASCSPLMNSRLDAAWRKIDIHDTQMKELAENLGRLAKTAAFLETIARWLLGIVTAVIVALVVAFVTGKIDIVIR